MFPQWFFFYLACYFYFSHRISLTLACAGLFLIFLLTVNHPPSPPLSPFSLDHSPTSLQYRPSSPGSLSSLHLPPFLLPQYRPSPHLPLPLLSAKQFIGSCSLIYQSNSSFPAAFGGEREEKPQAAFLKKPVAATGINMRSLGRCRFSLKLTFKLFHKYEIKPRAQMGLHPLLFWLRAAVILSSPA